MNPQNEFSIGFAGRPNRSWKERGVGPLCVPSPRWSPSFVILGKVTGVRQEKLFQKAHFSQRLPFLPHQRGGSYRRKLIVHIIFPPCHTRNPLLLQPLEYFDKFGFVRHGAYHEMRMGPVRLTVSERGGENAVRDLNRTMGIANVKTGDGVNVMRVRRRRLFGENLGHGKTPVKGKCWGLESNQRPTDY